MWVRTGHIKPCTFTPYILMAQWLKIKNTKYVVKSWLLNGFIWWECAVLLNSHVFTKTVLNWFTNHIKDLQMSANITCTSCSLTSQSRSNWAIKLHKQGSTKILDNNTDALPLLLQSHFCLKTALETCHRHVINAREWDCLSKLTCPNRSKMTFLCASDRDIFCKENYRQLL